ncbi:hypothetical protein KKA00_04805 [bacterium]|nr:hypothetical protein [bacterium]MBU1651516.1 hypothetical protein [bacterium]MBU1881764.1 hypothetical protein [bacterium]
MTTHEVEAQTQGFGLGIIVGEPTGISGKLWTGQTVAFAAGAAWSFEGESLHLHLDYLLHNFDVIPVGVGQLPVYFGIGGRVNLQDDDTKIGVRIPVGLNYHFEEAPVDLFLELVPIMDMIPDTDFFLNGGLGLRFFFGKNRKSN